MPGALSVPFPTLVSSDSLMLPEAELRARFAAAGVDVGALAAQGGPGPSVVTSCGSGLTACIVGLALHRSGLPLSKWAVYDGSWAEWGARTDTPIVKQGADGSDEPVP